MGILEVLEAVKALQDHQEKELKNFGDVDALFRSNPILSAIAKWMVAQTSQAIVTELEKRLPPVELELLDYKDVQRIMNKKTVGAVRQMKSRGYIEAAKFSENGKTYFTKEAVEKAIRDAEAREASLKALRSKQIETVNTATA